METIPQYHGAHPLQCDLRHKFPPHWSDREGCGRPTKIALRRGRLAGQGNQNGLLRSIRSAEVRCVGAGADPLVPDWFRWTNSAMKNPIMMPSRNVAVTAIPVKTKVGIQDTSSLPHHEMLMPAPEPADANSPCCSSSRCACAIATKAVRLLTASFR